MFISKINRLLSPWAVLTMLASVACAQVKQDVPFVTTPQPVVEEMLRLAAPKEGETLYDLGCGDGRIVITAAKNYKVKGIGVDIDPDRIRESHENAQEAGVTDRVEFLEENLFEMDFSDADVLCMYLLDSVNARLKPKILAEMKPGARVVSHAFDMGDWKPDQTVQVKAPDNRTVYFWTGNEWRSAPLRLSTIKPSDSRTVYFWIVPAQVDGTLEMTLKTPDGERKATLNLQQSYQYVSGTAQLGDTELQISDGKLIGDQLTFTADGQEYAGRVPAKSAQASATGQPAE